MGEHLIAPGLCTVLPYAWFRNLFPVNDPHLVVAVQDISKTLEHCTRLILHALTSPKGDQCATKTDLENLGKLIMSKISDYVTAVETQLDGIGQNVDGLVTAIGGINTSIGGIAGDVAELKRIIEQLNTNPGPITPEDQALLDASLVKLGALAAKAQAAKDAGVVAADAAAVLDAATETPPPAPNS